ncbi:MAG: hypothetical protein A2005_12505 [Desulfuromonadales bacterium GWC2_61_20]|nr:MAG: hypothetical protein A2005_12505 [Desulfuromonadales bacterium GWC2_61_20]
MAIPSVTLLMLKLLTVFMLLLVIPTVQVHRERWPSASRPQTLTRTMRQTGALVVLVNVDLGASPCGLSTIHLTCILSDYILSFEVTL